MRHRGRYCWSCRRRRPNERFSRKSALRGVCRDCRALGTAELAYRQVIVTIDRAMRHGELIPKQHRGLIAAMLAHADERVRAYASQIVDADQRSRQARAAWMLEEAAFEAWQEAWFEQASLEEASLEKASPGERGLDDAGGPNDADDPPF